MALLRVGIDGSDAKKGSKDVEDSLKRVRDEARKTTEAVDDQQATLEALGKTLTDSFATPFDRFREGMETTNALLKAGTISQDTYTKAVDRATQVYNESLPEYQRYNELMQQGKALTEAARTPLETMRTTQERYNEMLAQGAITQETYNRSMQVARERYNATSAAGRAMNQLQQEGRQLTQSLRGPVEIYTQQVAKLNALLKFGAISQDTFNRALATVPIPAALTGYGRLNEQFVSGQKAVGGYVDRLTNLKVILGAGAAAIFIRELAQSQTQLERIQDVFSATSRNAGEMNANWQFTLNLSRDMGINFEKTAESFSKFQAVTRDTVLEGQATRDIFVGINEATQALGLGADETASIFQRLQLMMTKGAVQMRELAALFGDRLPGALNLVAKSLGYTSDEFTRMISKGQIAVEDLLPALGRELHNTFGAAAMENAKDLEAQMERLNTQWNNLKMSIATAGSGSLKEGTGLLESVVGGWAILFGNALDPADQLNTEILKMRDTLKDMQGFDDSGRPLFSDKDIAAYRVELEKVEKQQRVQLGLEDTLAAARARIAAKANPAAKPLTDQQLEAIDTVTQDLQRQNKELELNARYGDGAATAMARFEAMQKLAATGVKALTPAIEAELAALDKNRRLAASATLVRSLEEQTGALRVQTAAGDGAAAALQRYQAMTQLAKAGLTGLTPAVERSLKAFQDATREASIAQLAKDLGEQTKAMEAQAAAGPLAAQALARLQMEAQLAKVGVAGLTTELEALWQRLQAAQAAVAQGDMLRNLQQQTAELRLQAQYGAQAGDALERYRLEVQLATAGVQGLTPELEAALAAKNAASDDVLLANMRDELYLLQLTAKEREREVATRKLSANATDEQRKAVEVLADSIRRAQQEQKIWENLAKQAAESIQSSFADFLFNPFEQGVAGMARGFVDSLRRMAAEALAQQAIMAILKALGGLGGGAGTFFQGMASTFGGARAEGGPVMAGKDYVVGEEGPEVVRFNKPGTVIPNSGLGGQQGATNVSVPVQVVNVRDPREIPKAISTDGATRKAILNMMADESSAIREILKVS